MFSLSVDCSTSTYNNKKVQLFLLTLFTEGASDFLIVALRNRETCIINTIHAIFNKLMFIREKILNGKFELI